MQSKSNSGSGTKARRNHFDEQVTGTNAFKVGNAAVEKKIGMNQDLKIG